MFCITRILSCSIIPMRGQDLGNTGHCIDVPIQWAHVYLLDLYDTLKAQHHSVRHTHTCSVLYLVKLTGNTQ